MDGPTELVVQVEPTAGEDADELAELTGWLQRELLDLDVAAVDRVSDQDVAEGAKGVGAVVSWLVVNLGPEALKNVLAKAADWATRNDRALEMTIGDKSLKIERPTRVEQEKLIDAFLAQL